jgi:hypothetical protein
LTPSSAGKPGGTFFAVRKRRWPAFSAAPPLGNLSNRVGSRNGGGLACGTRKFGYSQTERSCAPISASSGSLSRRPALIF